MRYTVRPFTTKTPRRARRGTPAIPAGTTVYVIAMPSGGYFYWSYLNRAAADKIAAQLNCDGDFRADFNRAHNPDHTVHTFITAAQIGR